MFQERRISPRVHCTLPAEIETSTGEMIDVQLVNISRSGFYVEGNEALASLQPPQGLGATEVWLHFGLEQAPIHCHCRIVYKRRNSHDSMGLGLHIVSTHPHSLSLIEQYVIERLD